MNQPQMLVIMWDDHFGMVIMYNDGDERFPISVPCNQVASWWDIWKQKGDSNDVTLLTAQQGIIWSPRIWDHPFMLLRSAENHLSWHRKTQIKKKKKSEG